MTIKELEETKDNVLDTAVELTELIQNYLQTENGEKYKSSVVQNEMELYLSAIKLENNKKVRPDSRFNPQSIYSHNRENWIFEAFENWEYDVAQKQIYDKTVELKQLKNLMWEAHTNVPPPPISQEDISRTLLVLMASFVVSILIMLVVVTVAPYFLPLTFGLCALAVITVTAGAFFGFPLLTHAWDGGKNSSLKNTGSTDDHTVEDVLTNQANERQENSSQKIYGALIGDAHVVVNDDTVIADLDLNKNPESVPEALNVDESIEVAVAAVAEVVHVPEATVVSGMKK